MKKVSSVLMAVVIFLVCVLSCSLTVFAIGEFLIDYSVSYVLDYFSDNLLNSLNSGQAKIEAARSYYFYKLVNNEYNYNGSVFSSDGTRFTDDYLNHCWDYYFEVVSANRNEYDSSGDVFLTAAGFDGSSWKLSMIAFEDFGNESGNTNNENTWRSDYKNYYQTYLARYILDQGGTASDPNPGKSGLDIAPGYVSSDDLKEHINKENTLYSPKGKDLFLNSYRTDKNYHREKIPSGYTDSLYYVTLFQNPQTMECLRDLYCLPFYKAEDGTMYYCDYMFHYYWVANDDPNSDIAFRADVYQFNQTLGYIYHDEYSGIIYEGLSYSMPYQIRTAAFTYSGSGHYNDSPYFSFVSDLTEYDDCKATIYQTVPYLALKFSYFLPDYSASYLFYRYSTNSSYITIYKNFFNSSLSGYPYSKNPNTNNDYGFICSESMISTVYNIDSSRIPSGQIIQITGDSNVYNYYMTDPETGHSSTVNEFVENNYTYITNNNGGEGSGSGGAGGDINVSGKVDVEGDIHVGVDVNINQGGTGVNPDDFIQGDLDLGGYYDDAVDMASGVNNFMQLFFSFLPAEILSLLGILIAVAIVCRLLGR
ncbi:MAG: hypothetical protein J1F28_00520 [Oscillospiraceae bacterium]|nr:hypothetical protein [Oscillospiraceae bacterium]